MLTHTNGMTADEEGEHRPECIIENSELLV